MDFVGKDVVSIKDFSEKEIEHILDCADKMAPLADGEKKAPLWKERFWLPFFMSLPRGPDCPLKVPCSD
jgi:aspartate carbamoyltransferase catalytic subunit